MFPSGIFWCGSSSCCCSSSCCDRGKTKSTPSPKNEVWTLEWYDFYCWNLNTFCCVLLGGITQYKSGSGVILDYLLALVVMSKMVIAITLLDILAELIF